MSEVEDRQNQILHRRMAAVRCEEIYPGNPAGPGSGLYRFFGADGKYCGCANYRYLSTPPDMRFEQEYKP